jgi:hypothetical protein
MLFGKDDSDCEGEEVHTRQLDVQPTVTEVCERSLNQSRHEHFANQLLA